MQFCKKHWDDLRGLIKEKGLSHLVSSSGEEAASRMKRQQEGQATLLEAHNMIMSRAIECLGLYIFTEKRVDVVEDGVAGIKLEHYCPLCEAREKLPPHPQTGLPCDESWLHTLTDYLKVEYAKEGWLSNN